jgi:two-component system, NarL family, sensor kinase
VTSDAELHRSAAPPQSAGWRTVVAPGPPRTAGKPPSLRRVVVQTSAAAVAVTLLVAFAGSALSRHIAENEAVHEVAQSTDILAESVIQPSLTDAMTTTAAAGAIDPTVRSRVLSDSVARVKLWSPDGTILYSDEKRLVGRQFPLDDGARSALSEPATRAEVTDLSRPENEFERDQHKLLEVYRPVWTPNGTELLFETYFRYDVVTDRSSQLWRGFAGITISTVLIIFLLLIPIIWTLLRRTRSAQVQRAEMIQRTLDASLEERQRIAAALHDGVVQEVAAASFAVAAAARSAAAYGDSDLSDQLGAASSTVRASMSGLRSLVVDIYPPSLQSAGLVTAVRDLTATLAGRGTEITVELDEQAAARLDADQQQAVFRIVQEALRNVVKHAGAARAEVTLAGQDSQVQVRVADAGRGFDPDRARGQHLGLTLMAEVARSCGAQLELRTAPGQGTTWLFSVPVR